MRNTETERSARELRLELEKLRESEKALEGRALDDPGEELLLEQVRQAMRERISRLADLAIEKQEAGS